MTVPLLSERTRPSGTRPSEVGAASVRWPTYDRSRLGAGLLHIGLGAFHRAHQALYTEEVVARGDQRWGITGVSLRDARVANALLAQDGLYSVTERRGDEAKARVVGALKSAWFAPRQRAQVLRAVADPATLVITTTVTEKGYSLQAATGDLDTDDPAIRHDLAHPEAPTSTLGVLAAGIRSRPASAPLTLVCCDNMAANGDTLRKLLLQYAGLIEGARGTASALARRIGDVGCPNTMVDRIVPAATPESLAWAETQLGLRDEAAIVCEPFIQWVIEDRFTGPRPAWEDAGALLTPDVRPFQAMKLRLLNGTHSAIAYLGQLRGLQTVSDVMADPLLAPFVRGVMQEDLLATVAVPAGYDAPAYCRELLRRFENPSLGHRTQQIAMDGTQKVPVRWLPALRESASAGIERRHLERTLAAWLHYLAAARAEDGTALTVSDPGAPALVERLRQAGSAREAVAAALSQTGIFGTEPWPEAFAARLTAHLQALRRGGTQALLAPVAR